MPRTLLLTTGTSIANRTAALGAYQKRATTWEDNAEDLREQIHERLTGFDLASEAGRVRASAELNILHRLPVRPDDEVVLFSTDTADGRACTEALAGVIQSELGVASVVIERVQGLQVRDAEALRHSGLTNLTRQLIRYLDDPQRRYGGGCVLCPNGGFKGVVPFLTVLGMIFRAPIIYVFEFAETVITLPPLPIGFATDLLERALPALDWANDTGVFDVSEFHRRIPAFNPEEAALFDSFLEITPDSGDGRLGSLSPLASVFIEREAGGGSLRLSTRATRDLEKLSASERREVEHHLTKLRSSFWRSQHRDTKPNSDLEFYPRGHNPWRFAGFTDAGLFHVCWFAEHAPYVRLIGQNDRQRRAFPVEEFSDYSPPITSDAAPEPNDPYQQHTWFDLRAEIEKLRAENLHLASQERVANQNTNRIQKLHHEARRTIDELISANRVLRERLQKLE
jgi:putative CRISPR-associated protein (TIGR02619 family)